MIRERELDTKIQNRTSCGSHELVKNTLKFTPLQGKHYSIFTWIPFHDPFPTLRDINLCTWQLTWRNSKWIMAWQVNHGMYRCVTFLSNAFTAKHENETYGIYMTIHVWIYSIGTDIRTLNWNSSEFPDNLLLTSRPVYAVSQTAHQMSLEDDKI